MENKITFHMTGPAVDAKLDVGGFVVDQAGAHSFVVDRKGVLQEAGLSELGWHGECCSYRSGDAWHFKSNHRHTQGPDHLRLKEMAFTSQTPGDEISVFLDGQRIGEGEEARIEYDFGLENEFIRAGGWVVARFKDGRWHRQDRRGDLHEAGCLTIGPHDFHRATAVAAWCRFLPEPRSRPSALASDRLALSF